MIDEWEERQVCPDGACIGVIGADGRCNICGHTAPVEGGAYRATPAVQVDSDDAVGDEARAELPAGAGHAATAAVETGGGGEWGDRKLCSDGTCTGVIGADGRCKVCRKAPA
jgi:hypothetical protein